MTLMNLLYKLGSISITTVIRLHSSEVWVGFMGSFLGEAKLEGLKMD